MARSLVIVEALGSPDMTAVMNAANAALSTVLASLIGSVQVLVTDRAPQYTRDVRVFVDTSTGGTVITHPYRLQAFQADTDITLNAQIAAFLAANPTYFIGPIIYAYSDLISSIPVRSMAFVLYNTSAADGSANWQPGFFPGGSSGPTGPAGGDLSGTYPNPLVGPRTSGELLSGAIPASATVIDTANTAGVSEVEWEVLLTKGTTRYGTTLRAQVNDGVTPTWGEDNLVLSPDSGGTWDCPLTCTITGGVLNLVCTPGTTGWSAEIRSRIFT